MWEAMKDAKLFERGKPPAVGHFDLVWTRALAKDTFEHGLAFIVEFEVFNTTNPAEQPEGSTCSFYQSMKHKGAAMSAIKALVIASLGYDFPKDKSRIEHEFDPIADRFMTGLTSAQNPGCGLFVHCESYPVHLEAKGDKPARTVTNQRFSPFDYERQGVERPDVHEVLAKASGLAVGGQIVSPVIGAPPPPPPPPAGRVFPPGTIFHPAGTWPGGGATHYLPPGAPAYIAI